MIEIREYIDDRGRSPFGRWFDGLDAIAATRVRTALARMEAGNLSNVRGVGSGVLEYRMHVGPGYRVYFGRDGDTLIVLLGGGPKRASKRTSRMPVRLGKSTNVVSSRRHEHGAHP